MTARWGSPNDRALGRLLAAGFLGLIVVNTLVPGAEAVLNTITGWLLVAGIVGAGGAAVAWVVLYVAGEWAIERECTQPLEGLTDPDTGKPYRAPAPEVTR